MPDPIRIAYVISGATAGGAERQVLNFVRACDASRISPAVITVLAADARVRRGGWDFRPELRELGIPLFSLDRAAFPDLRGAVQLYRTIRHLKPDVVQTYGLAVDLAVRMLRPFLPATAVVASVRGPENQRPALLASIDGWTSWLVDGYIANCAAGAEALIEKARVRRDKIAIIPNGIDIDRLLGLRDRSARFALRRELGIRKNEIAVACVANIHQAKGHEDILRAVALLNRKDVHFLFAGEDRSQGRIQSLAGELDCASKIHFLGVVRNIVQVLDAADIFLLPSHWEGMSNALMEAMCAGLPCVATDVGAAQELLDGGAAGVLVPPRCPERIASSLDRLIQDPLERRRLAEAAASRIRSKWTVGRMVASHEEYYVNLRAARPNGFTRRMAARW